MTFGQSRLMFDRVAVPVASLQKLDVRVTGVDVVSVGSSDPMSTGGTDGDSAGVGSGITTGADDSTNQVTGSVAVKPLLPRQEQAGKAVCVGSGTRIGAPPGCRDDQYVSRIPNNGGGTKIANRERVGGVRFRQSSTRAVVLRQPARPGSHWHAEPSEFASELEASGIHDGCSLQGSLCLGEYPPKPFRGIAEEVLDGQGSFGLIARFAAQREIADPVRTAKSLWPDVLDLQRYALGAAVGAGASPLFEEVLADLVSGECALLVLGRGQVASGTHGMDVEGDAFDVDLGNGEQTTETGCEAEDCVDAVPQRRGQPSFVSGAVVESRLAVTEIGRSASATVLRTLTHLLADLRTAMDEFDGVQPFASGVRFITVGVSSHGDPCSGGTGIDAQRDSADGGLLSDAILEPDRERRVACDDSAASGEEFTCACGVARHERTSALVEDRDERGPRRCPAGVSARVGTAVTGSGFCLGRLVSRPDVTPVRAGGTRTDLPSPLSSASARLGCRESVIRFVPAPRRVCNRGFQSLPLRKHGRVGLLTCTERNRRSCTSLHPRVGWSLRTRLVTGESRRWAGERVTGWWGMRAMD